jgi:hypothetical protein
VAVFFEKMAGDADGWDGFLSLPFYLEEHQTDGPPKLTVRH